MAFCARDPRVIVTVLYSKITYFKCLSQLSNNNSWFKCPSFRSYNVSFGTMEVLNRHVCPLRLGETSYAPVIPRRCLALPHSALWNSKKDELENKSVQYDPETKSLVQEMTQHFLEDFNAWVVPFIYLCRIRAAILIIGVIRRFSALSRNLWTTASQTRKLRQVRRHLFLRIQALPLAQYLQCRTVLHKFLNQCHTCKINSCCSRTRMHMWS